MSKYLLVTFDLRDEDPAAYQEVYDHLTSLGFVHGLLRDGRTLPSTTAVALAGGRSATVVRAALLLWAARKHIEFGPLLVAPVDDFAL